MADIWLQPNAAKLARMIGLSPKWQQLCGGLSAEAATSKVKIINIAGDERRPHCGIWIAPGSGYKQEAGGALNYMRPSGVMFLLFAFDFPPECGDDEQAANNLTISWLGEILTDVANLSGADDAESDSSHLCLHHLMIHSWQRSELAHRSSMGDYFFGEVCVMWGD